MEQLSGTSCTRRQSQRVALRVGSAAVVSAPSLVSLTGPSSVLGAGGQSQCAWQALSVPSPPEGGASRQSVSDSCPVGPPPTLVVRTPGSSSVLGAAVVPQRAWRTRLICLPPEGGVSGQPLLSDSCPVGTPPALVVPSLGSLCASRSVVPLGAAGSTTVLAAPLVRAPSRAVFKKGSLAAVLGGLRCPRDSVRAQLRTAPAVQCPLAASGRAPPRAPPSRPCVPRSALSRAPWVTDLHHSLIGALAPGASSQRSLAGVRPG